MTPSAARKLATTCAVLGLAAIGTTATSRPASAWWSTYGWGAGVYVPPVVAPPPAFYPPPAYYAPPARVWIPAHWQGNYWVPGHWS
jgi:hypothetical protein